MLTLTNFGASQFGFTRPAVSFILNGDKFTVTKMTNEAYEGHGAVYGVSKNGRSVEDFRADEFSVEGIKEVWGGKLFTHEQIEQIVNALN